MSKHEHLIDTLVSVAATALIGLGMLGATLALILCWVHDVGPL